MNFFDFLLMQYMNTLTYLSSDAFSSIPSDLVPDLQRMLSQNESFRPTAMDFTGKYSLPNQYIFSIPWMKNENSLSTEHLKVFLGKGYCCLKFQMVDLLSASFGSLLAYFLEKIIVPRIACVFRQE